MKDLLQLNKVEKDNLFIVLSGRTASGKDTIIAKILSGYPSFKKLITTTTRAPRDGEKIGIDYKFIMEEEFRRKINEGEFLEYVEYGGNFYGTEKSQILLALDYSVIWKIDPSRSGEIRQFIEGSFPSTISSQLLRNLLVIYLTVDDATILQRLKQRGLSEKEINLRIEEDKLYWERYKDKYDYVIENVPGKLVETVSQMSRIIEAQKIQ